MSDFRSLDQNGQSVNGLRGDYYSSLGGAYLFTVYGEGSIDNGAYWFGTTLGTVYEGQAGLWAGQFGPWSTFEERLSGEVFVGSGSSTPGPGPIGFFRSAHC